MKHSSLVSQLAFGRQKGTEREINILRWNYIKPDNKKLHARFSPSRNLVYPFAILDPDITLGQHLTRRVKVTHLSGRAVEHREPSAAKAGGLGPCVP